MMEEFDDLAWMFRCLSNRIRLGILKLLYEKDNLTVTEISEELKVKIPAISQHLAVLAGAGLVTSKKTGLYVRYRIKRAKFSPKQMLLLWLIISSFKTPKEGGSLDDAILGIAKGDFWLKVNGRMSS